MFSGRYNKMKLKGCIMNQWWCLNGSTTLDIVETDQAPSPPLSLSGCRCLTGSIVRNTLCACVCVAWSTPVGQGCAACRKWPKTWHGGLTPCVPRRLPFSVVSTTNVFTSSSCMSVKISNISVRKDIFLWLIAVKRWRNRWRWWSCIRDHPNTCKNIWNSWAEVL